MSCTASSGTVVSILVPVELQGAVQRFLDAYQQAPRNISDPGQLQAVERDLSAAADRLFTAAVRPVLQQSVAAREPARLRRPSLVPGWLSLLSLPGRLKNQGRRAVWVR